MSQHDIIPEHKPGQNQHTVSTRVMELVVAGFLMVIGAVVMIDNWRIGAGWSEGGPEAGYFPFYIGVILFVSSAITFLVHVFTKTPVLTTFVERGQLLLVLQVLVPTVIFVGLIGYLGLYVSAAIFIIFFMMWLGKYSIVKAAPVGVAIPVVLYILFEEMFLIPLPTGPLENVLGL